MERKEKVPYGIYDVNGDFIQSVVAPVGMCEEEILWRLGLEPDTEKFRVVKKTAEKKVYEYQKQR